MAKSESEKLRDEKKRLKLFLRHQPGVLGIGLTKLAGRRVIKINMAEATPVTVRVGTVPVLIEAVGAAAAQEQSQAGDHKK